MSLIHRTHYWGQVITAGNNDPDVDFDAIWTQFCFRKGGCCRGFGVRMVPIEDNDLVKAHNGDWNLYLVEKRYGRNEEHYFYKFAMIPGGVDGYGKKTCINKHRWEFVGTVDAYGPIQDLRDHLTPYHTGDMNDDSNVRMNHVHIGIMMDELQTQRSSRRKRHS
jgi:hypothetical protein